MSKDNSRQSTGGNTPAVLLKKVALIGLCVYVVLMVAFYFLAGQQLHRKDSAGNLEMLSAQSAAPELSAGTIVDQHFTVNMEQLSSVSVQWGTAYRQNAGTVVMELYRLEPEKLLLSGSFDAATITEGGITTITADVPLEGLSGAPLMLHIYSPDAQPGSAVAPLIHTDAVAENTRLYTASATGAQPIDATLCFSIEGFDSTWIGQYYWLVVAGGLILLLAWVLITARKVKHNRRSYVLGLFLAMDKYRFLIRQLVARDFKTKYKRSMLGMFWSFLNPLLMMCVQYFIFSTLFKSDIPQYAAYLLIGIVCFNFFSEVCNLSLYSILSNASLITKVYMPKYIYPLTRVLSSVVNLGISLIPLIIVCLLTGVQFQVSAILAVFFLVCLMLFSLGMAFLLSSAMVFFRDTQFLWSVFSTVWMYATAIFYPETILPENLRFVLYVNPIYHFIKNIRICILDGISPAPVMYVLCLGIALLMLGLGALVFKKSQDKFVLYL